MGADWVVQVSDQFERDVKRLEKRYPRELVQMLSNLQRYAVHLFELGNPLLLVEYAYVHREASGCHAITQQPLRSSAQTRLYVYGYVEEREFHLICSGDKASQMKDNQFCRSYVHGVKSSKME